MEEIMIVIGYSFLTPPNFRIIILTLIHDIGFLKNAAVTNHGLHINGNNFSLNNLFLNRLQPSRISIKFEEIVKIDEKRIRSFEILTIPTNHYNVYNSLLFYLLFFLFTVVS